MKWWRRTARLSRGEVSWYYSFPFRSVFSVSVRSFRTAFSRPFPLLPSVLPSLLFSASDIGGSASPLPCLPPFALRLAMCSCATAYTSLPALTTPNNNQRERKEMNCERRSLHTHNSDAKWWRLPPDIQQTMSVTDDLNLSGGKFEYELWKIITSSKPRNCNVMTFWHGRIYREKNRWWHFNILTYSFPYTSIIIMTMWNELQSLRRWRK